MEKRGGRSFFFLSNGFWRTVEVEVVTGTAWCRPRRKASSAYAWKDASFWSVVLFVPDSRYVAKWGRHEWASIDHGHSYQRLFRCLSGLCNIETPLYSFRLWHWSLWQFLFRNVQQHNTGCVSVSNNFTEFNLSEIYRPWSWNFYFFPIIQHKSLLICHT